MSIILHGTKPPAALDPSESPSHLQRAPALQTELGCAQAQLTAAAADQRHSLLEPSTVLPAQALGAGEVAGIMSDRKALVHLNEVPRPGGIATRGLEEKRLCRRVNDTLANTPRRWRSAASSSSPWRTDQGVAKPKCRCDVHRSTTMQPPTTTLRPLCEMRHRRLLGLHHLHDLLELRHGSFVTRRANALFDRGLLLGHSDANSASWLTSAFLISHPCVPLQTSPPHLSATPLGPGYFDSKSDVVLFHYEGPSNNGAPL